MSVWTYRQIELLRKPRDRRQALASPAKVSGATPARAAIRRRLIAAAALFISVAVFAMQFGVIHSAKSQRDPYLRRFTLRPGTQSSGSLRLDAPLATGEYSIDAILPNNASPLDFGIAFHEVRRHVKVIVSQDAASSPLLAAPSPETYVSMSDRLDSRDGVELGHFAARSAAPVTITCEATDGPPWPADVQIGISHSTLDEKVRHSQNLARATRPFSFGLSAVMGFAGLIGFKGKLSLFQ
jgi:hypothetical protein